MSEMNEDAVTMLQSIFSIPDTEPVRRAIEITGSVEAASEWFIENDWRELQLTTEAQLTAESSVGGVREFPPQGGARGEEDQLNDDDLLFPPPAALDGMQQFVGNIRALSGELASVSQPPAKRARKVVNEDAPKDGSDSFWCAFDSTVAHKSYLQLMNLRPKNLGHSRIVVSGTKSSSQSRQVAEKALADIWTHCLAAKEPGYWLVPILPAEIDDIWWKVLEPHLLRKCFGDVLIFQTFAASSVSAGALSSFSSRTRPNIVKSIPETENDSAKAMLIRASARLPRFDDFNTNEHQSNAETSEGDAYNLAAMIQNRRETPRSSMHRPQNLPIASVILLASGTPSELKRVGEYLAALFPSKAPLYFRRLRGTATDAAKSDLTTVFANDPRADPSCLTPDWHTKHAEIRVSRRQRNLDMAKHHDPLAPGGPRPMTLFLEQRTPPGGTDWDPFPAPPLSNSTELKKPQSTLIT